MMTYPRFDGADIWQRFSAEDQARIGAAAVELLVTAHGCQLAEERDDKVFMRAGDEAGPGLMATLDNHVGRALLAISHAAVDQPHLPSRIGEICTSCGCSEADACASGCSWVAPGLCSSCLEGMRQ